MANTRPTAGREKRCTVWERSVRVAGPNVAMRFRPVGAVRQSVFEYISASGVRLYMMRLVATDVTHAAPPSAEVVR